MSIFRTFNADKKSFHEWDSANASKVAERRLSFRKLVRPQPVFISRLTVLRCKVKAIFFRQRTAYFRAAYSFVTVGNEVAVIVYPVKHQMAMGMLGVIMSGYDILRVANPHPLHPFPGNLHHERISFLIVGETSRILR